MASVLVIGDTHCPGMRRGYVEFLQRVADRWGIDRVVHIGDLVDWHAISYHERNPSLPSPSAEYRKALRQVRTLKAAFPHADWMIGNHDALTSRQAFTAGLPAEVLRSYNELWEVDWTVHERFGSLVIDGVLYQHGENGTAGKDAALNQAKANFQSTVIGHHHSNAGVKWWANPRHQVFGMSVGCGIDLRRLQFDYGRRYTAKPVLGCGVVIDGKQAVFEPWHVK